MTDQGPESHHFSGGKDVKARTWFITGAASGLGLHLTTQLLDRGERVAATARKPDALRPLAERFAAQLWVARLDVTDTAGLRQVVADAFTELGRIDVIVSCAGVGAFGAAEELSDELIARQIDVNLVGSIQLARAVTPWLRAQGGGRIIQISSSGGQVADPGMSVYNASKFGLEGFFESLSIELAPFGIDTTLVEPGGTRTNFNRNLALADPLPFYQDGVLGRIRAMLGDDADPEVVRHAIAGDPAKIAGVVINSVETSPAPPRLTLGGVAFASVRAALRDRLAYLEGQAALASSTDADDAHNDGADSLTEAGQTPSGSGS